MRRRIRYSKLSLLILVIHRLNFWMQLLLGLDLSKHWSCLGTIWIDHCYDLNFQVKGVLYWKFIATYFGQYNHVHSHNQIRMHTQQQYMLSQTFWNSEMLVHHGHSSYKGNSLTCPANLSIDSYYQYDIEFQRFRSKICSSRLTWLKLKFKVHYNQSIWIVSVIGFPCICGRCVGYWACIISVQIWVKCSYDIICACAQTLIISTAPVKLILNNFIWIFCQTLKFFAPEISHLDHRPSFSVN